MVREIHDVIDHICDQTIPTDIQIHGQIWTTVRYCLANWESTTRLKKQLYQTWIVVRETTELITWYSDSQDLLYQFLHIGKLSLEQQIQVYVTNLHSSEYSSWLEVSRDPSTHPSHTQRHTSDSLFRDFCKFIATVRFRTEHRQHLLQDFRHDDPRDPNLSYLRRGLQGLCCEADLFCER